MARHKGILHAIAQAQRESERKRMAQLRAQATQAKAREKARADYEKAREAHRREQAKAVEALEAITRASQKAVITDQKERERQAKAAAQAAREAEKEQQRLYLESRVAEVELKNADLEETIAEIQEILVATLSVDDALDLDTLKHQPMIAPFDPGPLGQPRPAPLWANYDLAPLSAMQKLIPGAKARYEQQVAQARALRLCRRSRKPGAVSASAANRPSSVARTTRPDQGKGNPPATVADSIEH